MGRVLGTAALVLALVGGAGFGLQAIGLQRPSSSELIASGALRRLLFLRVVGVAEFVGGKRTGAVCVQTSARAGRRQLPEPAEFVVLGRRDRLIDRGYKLIGPGRAALRLLRFELAACPQPLVDRFGGALERRRLKLRPTHLGAIPAFELRVGRPWRQLRLYVSRRGLHPIALHATLGSLSGWSWVRSSDRDVSAVLAHAAKGALDG